MRDSSLSPDTHPPTVIPSTAPLSLHPTPPLSLAYRCPNSSWGGCQWEGGQGAEHQPGKEFSGLSRTPLAKDGKRKMGPELIPGCTRAGISSSFSAAIASPHLLTPQAPGRSQQNRSVFINPGPLTDTSPLLKRQRETKLHGLFLDLSDRFF